MVEFNPEKETLGRIGIGSLYHCTSKPYQVAGLDGTEYLNTITRLGFGYEGQCMLISEVSPPLLNGGCDGLEEGINSPMYDETDDLPR